jgi:hypothetical protein
MREDHSSRAGSPEKDTRATTVQMYTASCAPARVEQLPVDSARQPHSSLTQTYTCAGAIIGRVTWP